MLVDEHFFWAMKQLGYAQTYGHFAKERRTIGLVVTGSAVVAGAWVVLVVAVVTANKS